MTLPTVTAQFTATGAVGAVEPIDFTEFVLPTTVSIIGSVTFDGYPSCSACASGDNPLYQAPSPLASTTITSTASNTVSVTGISPSTGSPSGAPASPSPVPTWPGPRRSTSARRPAPSPPTARRR